MDKKKLCTYVSCWISFSLLTRRRKKSRKNPITLILRHNLIFPCNNSYSNSFGMMVYLHFSPRRKQVTFSLIFLFLWYHLSYRETSHRSRIEIKRWCLLAFLPLNFQTLALLTLESVLALQPCRNIQVGRAAPFRSSNADRRRVFAGRVTPPLRVAG